MLGAIYQQHSIFLCPAVVAWTTSLSLETRGRSRGLSFVLKNAVLGLALGLETNGSKTRSDHVTRNASAGRNIDACPIKLCETDTSGNGLERARKPVNKLTKQTNKETYINFA